MFEDSALIVAHPDDDILWLSSVFDKVGKIVFCFNDLPRGCELGPARKKTIAAYPLPNVSSLDITEPYSFNKADWLQPVITDYGLELSRNQDVDAIYRETFDEVSNALADVVRGKKNIFTHNPWGDYGHEDHVLVYRALKTLQPRYGYMLWFSNYCSNRSFTLMNQYVSGFRSDYQCLPANLALAHEIADLYRQYGCWTWYEDYQWFDHECLMKEKPSVQPSEQLAHGHLFPLNYLKTELNTEPPAAAPNPLLKAAGRLKRKVRKIL
jgi:hypothetical protein